MLRPVTALVTCVTAVAVAQLWIGRAGAAAPARTPPIKWLINTGNVAGRWPPSSWTGRSGCDNNTATPNAISRMQMIRGGTAAVLVMPAGDGGRRCCGDGTLAQFSLGLVELKHGLNNLYPAVRPFPDWRTFVDGGSPAPNEPDRDDTGEPPDERGDRGAPRGVPAGGGRHRRIVNAVDAFLDDRGRILWVLDSGQAGEDACNGILPTDATETDDLLLKPKFVAVDVYTNQIIDVVSLSRVWRPGVSCFQYIVSVYLDAEENDDSGCASAGGEADGGSGGEVRCTLDWPLVVIGDAGTSRVLVYTHSNDRFTEIIMPLEEEHNALHDADNNGTVDGRDGDDGGRPTLNDPNPHRHSRWPTPPIRDILYLAPLSIRPGHVRLLITYHGCREVYKLRLEPSTSDPPSYDDGADARDATLTSLSPVIGTLAVLGRKPCRMVVLGTDRLRTDVVGESFGDGGTTVYFRLENTNDIWSWKVFSGKKKLTGAHLYIDERDFRLVRLGRTCRVPVAVSVAPAAVGNGCAGDADPQGQDAAAVEKSAPRNRIRQIVWMLETNFVDHFAGTADRMGANAKLQPLEAPLNDANAARALSFDAAMQTFPLRSQPVKDHRNSATGRRRRRRQSSKRCSGNALR